MDAMTDERLSEETVSAFVDGELDGDERLHVLSLSQERDAVRRQLCETRKLKDLVREAYANVPLMVRSKPAGSPREARFPPRALAAAVAAVMFLAGMLAGRSLPGPSEPAMGYQDPVFLELSELVSLDEAEKANGRAANIVLHLATDDGQRVSDALAKIDRFVGQQQSQGFRRVQVEIVANGRGLDLLRIAHTPYEAKVKQLARDDYVTILACRQAVQRLRERGVTVDLIPEADLAASALDRIIQRLREGWVYVKV
jgi:intracellular sulfur oxidation DsrE/DsrF family protein